MDEIDFGAAMAAPPVAEPQVAPVEIIDDPIILPQELDIRSTALSLVPYSEKVKALVNIAKVIQVTDEDSRKRVTDIGLQAKKLRLAVEKIEDSPNFRAANQFIKDVRHLVKTLTMPLKVEVEQVCKAKLSAFAERLRLEQARREAEARERARQLQLELDAEAEKQRQEALEKARAAEAEIAAREAAGVVNEAEKAILQQTVDEEREAAESIVAPVVAVEVQETPNIVRTGEGASYTTVKWVAELVDIDLVERKYLIVDMRAIQKDVDGGLRQAPGFIIRERTGTSFRG
jgi:hypothetical protein